MLRYPVLRPDDVPVVGHTANVLDYGAVGNGTTDDATAFAAAITAVTSNGGTVYMPPGYRFKIGTTLTFPTGVCFYGGGSWNTTSAIVPASNAIATLIQFTGSWNKFGFLLIDASAIVTPTFVAIKVNTGGGGGQRGDDVRIYGAGTGLSVLDCNAGRFTNWRIEQSVTCIATGGVNGSFPGDCTFTEQVLLPTAAGTGMVIDGNSNALYMQRVQVAGGTICLNIRGSGASTAVPDGIQQTKCNYTASSGPCVQVLKGTNILLGGKSVIGGSTADSGLLLNAATVTDIDGVLVGDTEIRANFKHGIYAQKGANLTVVGSPVYGNSNGGGSGTFDNIRIGTAWTGLCHVVGNMLGVSKAGELFANIQAPAGWGIKLEASSLTTSGNFVGRLEVWSNVLQGNTTGQMSDASTPDYKYIGASQNPSGPTAITVTASPFTYTAGGSPEVVYINGGTVSDVSTGATTIFAGSNVTVNLEPGKSVVVTYTLAPTMVKVII
jgi:hypothetical protein